ncbi:MAG: UDP-N-acetylenolpyruvoylglucosamine reductase [Chitinophagaceae bacterium]|nr:MAG: UDP-N-acetylenolpyruvoylglucosamine reductase [Chitinophagaceae bacterium]
MSTLQENVSMRPITTFGVEAKARFYAPFHDLDELNTLLDAQGQLPLMVLGGGSNVLFTRDFDGLLLHNGITGIETVREDDSYVYVRAGGGENWHRFVLQPMQNIGAYGVEIKDVFHELEAFHIRDRRLDRFSLEDCRFGYRESVFKNIYKGEYVITSVTYRLRKTPEFHTEYGAIRQELESMGVTELSIGAISQAVINIRSSKLPDWREVGNAGSFFKNPQVSLEKFAALKDEHPGIVAFPQDPGMKLAAGWLIEQCGWKGFRRGDAGCYPKQALVLVNYGAASGSEIYALSAEIIDSVEAKFGVTLEREVNVV